MKVTLLKIVSKVVHFSDFFFRVCSMYIHFENTKVLKIIPYLRYPKFKQREKLIVQLQSRSQGSSLAWLQSTCFNDSIAIKIKKLFTLSFFFKKPCHIFMTMVMVYKLGDLNFSIYPIKKALFSFYCVIFFLLSCSWKEKVVLYISKINSNIYRR